MQTPEPDGVLCQGGKRSVPRLRAAKVKAPLLEVAGERCSEDEFGIVGTFSALFKTSLSHVSIG